MQVLYVSVRTLGIGYQGKVFHRSSSPNLASLSTRILQSPLDSRLEAIRKHAASILRRLVHLAVLVARLAKQVQISIWRSRLRDPMRVSPPIILLRVYIGPSCIGTIQPSM